MNWLWETIGFVGFVTNIIGNLFLAWRWRSGWPVRLLPNVCWAAYSIHFWNVALLANSLTFFVINCMGWWKWSKAKKHLCRHCGTEAP